MAIDLTSQAERLAVEAQKLPAFDGINLLGIKRKVAEILTLIGREGIFGQYSKHDISHLDAMLAILDWLIPADTARSMTAGDWLTAVLAVYFHDLGMVVTRHEFESRDQQRVLEFAETHLFAGAEGADYRARIQQLTPSDRERFLYQEYVRHEHPLRIAKWIQGQEVQGSTSELAHEVVELLGPLKPQYRRDLAWICESHHLDDLKDFSKYRVAQPYGQQPGETVNLQYSAILLRMADLLHMTSDRTPSVLFRVINPSDPVSQEEWARQLAVSAVTPKPAEVDGVVDRSAPQDTIQVHAFFQSPDGFFGLTSYITYVRDQLRKVSVWANLAETTQGSRQHFPWKQIDDSHIETEGFLRQTFGFTIDQARILDLLTGHTLYNDPDVALRELVQNAIDAVRAMRLESNDPNYTGAIAIEWDSAKRTLSVTDDGTGMSQATIENHLLRVGASRYQQDEFRKAHPDFYPISRFGIGILSTFMLADAVEIITSNPDDDKARRLELRSVHGKYLVSVLDKASDGLPIGTHGTRVTLNVRPSAKIHDIRDIARHWIVVPGCRVTLAVDKGEPQPIGHESVGHALVDELTRLGWRAKLQGEGQPSNRAIEVRQTRRGAVDLAYAVQWNEYFREWSFVLIKRRDEEEDNQPMFGTCIEGIRVEFDSPGFEGIGIAAMANATGADAPRTNVARTGIDPSEQRSSLLQDVYGIPCAHVTTEINELSSQRGFSLTWALQEAPFLLGPIGPGSDEQPAPVDSRALFRQMFQIKCLAIENAGHRVSASPDEVASFPDFWTIDGQLFRSAEGLMREAGGSTSLATLVKTIAGDHMNLPDGPILCGFGDYPLASDAARARKEIGRILANVRDRRVDLLWVTRADPPRWRTHQSPRVPRYASAGLRRRLSSRPVTFAVAPVDTFGLEEFTRVRAFNHLYVLYDAEVAPLLADLAEREESDEEFQPLGAVLWDILVRETAGLAPSVIVERIEAQYQRALSDGARRLVPISKLYDLTDFAVAITRPMWRTFDTSAWVRTDPNVFFDG